MKSEGKKIYNQRNGSVLEKDSKSILCVHSKTREQQKIFRESYLSLNLGKAHNKSASSLISLRLEFKLPTLYGP